jgi:hypothetical protein
MAAMRLTEPGPPVAWADTYQETARGIVAAAEAAPLPGDHGVATAGAWLVVQGWNESRFNPNAEHDHGLGHGEWGVHTGTARNIPGCSKAELIVPASGARCALSLLHTSFNVCSGHPFDERMGWYAYGKSGCEHRLGLSRYRMGVVAKLIEDNPPTF